MDYSSTHVVMCMSHHYAHLSHNLIEHGQLNTKGQTFPSSNIGTNTDPHCALYRVHPTSETVQFTPLRAYRTPSWRLTATRNTKFNYYHHHPEQKKNTSKEHTTDSF